MKKIQNKTRISTITVILILTLSSILTILPTVFAQAPATAPSYPFIGATPNPVQVNQYVLFHVGIAQQLASTSHGWTDLSITILRPDGQTDTIDGIRTDSTGGTGVVYLPTMIGTYTAQLHFPDQEISFDKLIFTLPVGGIKLAADSEEIEVVVQEEAIPYYPDSQLPDEYWTRPVNAQLYEWAEILGDWPKPQGSYYMPPIAKYHTGNADFPETGHVLWTKRYTQGGIANDQLGNVQYEMGDAYEYKFIPSIILSGVLYYNRYEARGSNPDLEQEVVAVDIKTGEELWVRNWNNEKLAFGQTFHWDSHNYHGAFGYLWTTNPDRSTSFSPPNSPQTWKAYDPLSGRWEYTMENVPPGENLYGPKGEIYRYTVNLNAGWMTLWNSSRVVSTSGSWRPQGNTYDALNGIEWNVTIPEGLPGSVAMTFFQDRIHGSQANSLFGWTGTDITSWAIDVSPGNEGDLIFNKTVSLPETVGMTKVWADAMIDEKRFIISAKENIKYYAFDLDTGDLVWTSEPEHYLSIYDKWFGVCYGYGKFFTGRQSGIVTAYDLETGNVEWTYDVKDEFAEMTWGNNFPITYHFLADGKICLSYAEHSPINPLPRGAPMVVLDVETGEKIWEISWVNNWWGGNVMIGDSTIVGLNGYDSQIYSIGKGPTETTVEAPLTAVPISSEATITGKVIDVSPGTQDFAITARFPNGVPAVADADMTDWMEYVYMQLARPANAMGVTVTLEAIDPNMNYQYLGTTTTDANGNYGFSYKPEVPGKYMIMATFYGSNAYFGSTTTTYFTAEPEVSEVTIPPYPGYQGPSAQEVANKVLADLPEDPTADEISNAVINQLPEYPEPAEIPEYPEYTTIDIVIIVALIAVAVLVLFTLYKVSKLK